MTKPTKPVQKLNRNLRSIQVSNRTGNQTQPAARVLLPLVFGSILGERMGVSCLQSLFDDNMTILEFHITERDGVSF